MTVRRLRPGKLLPLVLVVLGSCGSGQTSTTISGETVATTGSPPTSAAPDSTTVPSTTAPEPVTTSSASPPSEPWHVDGRTYYFPVQPPDEATYGAEHHDYPATDIFAPVGATLVAVTDGTIDEVGRVDEWDPEIDDPATRSGLYVSVVGADGVRYYYSHLSRVESGISAGVGVHAGQVIGAVGNSGNARLTPAHVHFGISHPTFPGDWETRRGEVPPYPYLVAWEVGDQLAPTLR